MPRREADVVRAFADHLRDRGWTVDLDVERVDVVATRGGRTFIAEAKGVTSAPGLDVDTGYGQLLRRMRDDPDVSYGLVVPDQLEYPAMRVQAHVLAQLDVSVYLVDDAGSVRLGAGPDTAGVVSESRPRPNTTGQDAHHPVDQFLARLEEMPVELYPEELVPVGGRHVDGVAGFPAGRGLYAPCGWDHAVPPPFPFGGLMLVGNHLDAEDAYVEKLAVGAANGDPCPGAPRMRFWTMLYALLDEAEIPREEIFVTNVHPALLRGRSATGTVRASEPWLAACEQFLRLQVEVMKPRVIAGMGRPAQEFLERLTDARWTQVPEAVAVSIDGHEVSIAAIRHPSASQSHAGREQTASVLHAAMAAE